jgi:hypothetical protein
LKPYHKSLNVFSNDDQLERKCTAETMTTIAE